jgi:hypothetical protein
LKHLKYNLSWVVKANGDLVAYHPEGYQWLSNCARTRTAPSRSIERESKEKQGTHITISNK